MSKIEVDLLKENLSNEEAGLESLFEQWHDTGDYTYQLKFGHAGQLLILFTEVATNRIEVFELDIKQVV